MKRMVIIGGSGGVGHAVAPLLSTDYEVIALGSKQFPLPNLPNEWGDADIVVNMAALTTECPLNRFDILTKRVIDVNCLGAVNILAHFLHHMISRKWGRIIFFSSIYSDINVQGQGVYSASKAFIDKLVKIAAIENAQHGVTVNSIQLGYTGLGMGDVDRDLKDKALNKVMMRRFVKPEEIAGAIKFIIETEYFTGQNLKLCGGLKQ